MHSEEEITLLRFRERNLPERAVGKARAIFKSHDNPCGRPQSATRRTARHRTAEQCEGRWDLHTGEGSWKGVGLRLRVESWLEKQRWEWGDLALA